MNRRTKVFAGLASALTLVVLALGIAVLGAPADQRAQGLDKQRVQDLQRTSIAVEAYYKADATLPPDLEALRMRLPNRAIALTDATTGQAYEYRPTGERTYELCAHFEAPSIADPRWPTIWIHGAGRHCFGLGVVGQP